MSIEPITPADPRLRLPALYNIYPLLNELHPTGVLAGEGAHEHPDSFLDRDYGRVFFAGRVVRSAVYGRTERMEHYVRFRGLEVVDELRVPYRLIPIFAINDLQQIPAAVESLARANPNYSVLMRGQGTTYLLRREAAESALLYGGPVAEPSFKPSFLRRNFHELTLHSIWHNQAALLLNDVGFDYASLLPESALTDYWNDIRSLRRTPYFDGFALGIAQHYGLPSVGLDLTDDHRVAAWFALYDMAIDAETRATTCNVVSPDTKPTIFVFRCPKDTVFDYRAVRPKQFPHGRPDRQAAWFAHVGWGAAENQMALYLMCGIRIHPHMAGQLPNDFTRYLFPKTEDDLILQFFRKMRSQAKYEGEARRALQLIYHCD